MTRSSSLKFTVLASSLAALVALSAGNALAQSVPGLNAGATVRSTLVAVKTHQDDLEAMISDLSKVQTPDNAKSYEAYLSGQMKKYVNNHNTLHHGAIQDFSKALVGGKAPGQAQVAAEKQKLDDAADKVSASFGPSLAVAMARVEKLNPSLKKNFDVLRTLD